MEDAMNEALVDLDNAQTEIRSVTLTTVNRARSYSWAVRSLFASACRSFHAMAPFLSISGRNSQNVSP
jgi:hypothetical protein